MSLEAEREMWEAVASQPAPAPELAWRDGSQGRECVPNAARLPQRCAAHDRYDNCPDASTGSRPVDRCYCPDDCRCRRETNAPCGCKRH